MCGERGQVERLRVVVVVLVGDDEHPGVAATPLHVLPRRAVLDAAAPVVAPWMRGSFDGFLPILPPGVAIRGNIRDLVAHRRHPHHPLLPRPLLLWAVAFAVVVGLSGAVRRLPGRRSGDGVVGHADELAAHVGEEGGGRRRGAHRVVEAERDHLRLLAAPRRSRRRHLDVERLLADGCLVLLELEPLLLMLLLRLLLMMKMLLVQLKLGAASRRSSTRGSRGSFRAVDVLRGGGRGGWNGAAARIQEGRLEEHVPVSVCRRLGRRCNDLAVAGGRRSCHHDWHMHLWWRRRWHGRATHMEPIRRLAVRYRRDWVVVQEAARVDRRRDPPADPRPRVADPVAEDGDHLAEPGYGLVGLRSDGGEPDRVDAGLREPRHELLAARHGRSVGLLHTLHGQPES